MRSILQLAASMALLATQVNVPQLGFGDLAAADASAPTPTATVYEVKLDTTSTVPVQLASTTSVGDYNQQVLAPLTAAQAAEAAKAKAAAARVRLYRLQLIAQLVPGSHTDWMAAAGIAASDYGYVDYIISHESGWGVTKSNYAGSGAYGLGQAYPASKMAPFGADYLTNPVTQLKWANAYALGRYGSWANAYAHWLAYHRW